MKKIITLLAVFQLFFFCLLAQTNLPPVDKSPMDMSYYPNNYPVLKIQDKITEPLAARIVYSRPQKGGRVIFGGLVKNGEIWRMGANEATEIEFFKNVRVCGKKIAKGRYTLYAIVNENNWTIIVNRDTDTWGSFKYNQKKDVIRMDVMVQKTDAVIESLVMAFEKSTTGFNLIIAWDNVKVSVPFTF
jgi:hypothetical protein